MKRLASSKPGARQIDPSILAASIALRVNDAANLSGLSRNSIYNLINEGKLPARMVAGRRLILRSDLVTLLRGKSA